MKWPAWLYRLVPYLGRRAAERDVDEELRVHLELERERQRDAGLSEEESVRAARRRLGNATLVRERTRDVWGWRWLDDLGRDLRHAARGLGRSPGFAATVVLVLALGIGANVAMFSVVHGMLIRPLPYPDAGAIVRITESMGPRAGSSIINASLEASPSSCPPSPRLDGSAPESRPNEPPPRSAPFCSAAVSSPEYATSRVAGPRPPWRSTGGWSPCWKRWSAVTGRRSWR